MTVQIPREVAQQENSWKIVKDVVRNLIDGQPKKVDLSSSIFWCGFQSHDDVIQAYGMGKEFLCDIQLTATESGALAGRTWYDVVNHGNNRLAPTMEVTCLKVQRDRPVEWLRGSSQFGQQGRHLSTVSHTRTSSTSSTSSTMWTPLSPTATSYSLLPPLSLMPVYYTPTPISVGSVIPPSMAPRVENLSYIPASAIMPVYGHNLANPVGFAQSPPIYAQASATGYQLPLQNPPRASSQRRQIIVTNLYVGVKENRLKEFFQDSVGPVQECRIEERGDKKRHALVSFTHAEHAQLAINRFNETMIFGRKINARFTKEVHEGPVIVDGSDE
ncbi:MAG: hypothetical protein Q9209_005650 [Squamulea sp. 1 TL-2023]